tara:strand:- start:1427 stop:2107 length:681 start_codon:yes stop_codon:yes gene_type:complete
MLKIKNMLIVAIAIVSFSTTSFAGSLGLGVTGSFAVVEGSGTEVTEGTETGDVSVRDATASNNAVVASIFAEYIFDNNVAIGIDLVPGSADVNQKDLSRTDITADAAEAVQDDGKSTAQATVSNHITLYTEVPVHAGLYGKLGYVEMDVKTKESSVVTTRGKYGDTKVDGILYGAGYKNDFGSNSYYKVEGTHTQFDTLKLVSTSTNKITADLDVTKLTFALGYKF